MRSGIDFPALDEDAIREKVVEDLFDRIERAHERVVEAAQKHGVTMAGGGSAAAQAEWREAELELRSRKTTWQLLMSEARSTIRGAIADAEVVHEGPEAS
jgi:hypothetical protein